MTNAQHDLLHRFFAGFFHQDWRVEADTPEGVVTNYAYQSNEYAQLPELSDAILQLVADHPDDDELADVLFKTYHCFYSPKALGQSTKAWLVHIAEQVRAQIGK